MGPVPAGDDHPLPLPLEGRPPRPPATRRRPTRRPPGGPPPPPPNPWPSPATSPSPHFCSPPGTRAAPTGQAPAHAPSASRGGPAGAGPQVQPRPSPAARSPAQSPTPAVARAHRLAPEVAPAPRSPSSAAAPAARASPPPTPPSPPPPDTAPAEGVPQINVADVGQAPGAGPSRPPALTAGLLAVVAPSRSAAAEGEGPGPCAFDASLELESMCSFVFGEEDEGVFSDDSPPPSTRNADAPPARGYGAGGEHAEGPRALRDSESAPLRKTVSIRLPAGAAWGMLR